MCDGDEEAAKWGPEEREKMRRDIREHAAETGNDPLCRVKGSDLVATFDEIDSLRRERDQFAEALAPFAKVAEHWRAELYMRGDQDCPMAWASDVSARLLTGMASELPRVKFEAFRRAYRALVDTRETAGRDG